MYGLFIDVLPFIYTLGFLNKIYHPNIDEA